MVILCVTMFQFKVCVCVCMCSSNEVENEIVEHRKNIYPAIEIWFLRVIPRNKIKA